MSTSKKGKVDPITILTADDPSMTWSVRHTMTCYKLLKMPTAFIIQKNFDDTHTYGEMNETETWTKECASINFLSVLSSRIFVPGKFQWNTCIWFVYFSCNYITGKIRYRKAHPWAVDAMTVQQGMPIYEHIDKELAH